MAVLTDRGLESADLFRAIVARGFHPLMRATSAGTFRPAGWTRFRPMGRSAARDGQRFAAAGTAYATAPLACTLLACRAAGCADPWLILTDLPPSAADPCWYALRSWIEQGFKVAKSGGGPWHRARMTDPARAARLWLAVAVGTLWLVEVGGLAEAELRSETIPRFRTTTGTRVHRLFRIGLGLILAGLLRGQVLAGRFIPEPWPDPVPIEPLSEHDSWRHMIYPCKGVRGKAGPEHGNALIGVDSHPSPPAPLPQGERGE